MGPVSALPTEFRAAASVITRIQRLHVALLVGHRRPGELRRKCISPRSRRLAQDKYAGRGIGYAFSGQSYQERASGGQGGLVFALDSVMVFWCWAAHNEAWRSRPASKLGRAVEHDWARPCSGVSARRIGTSSRTCAASTGTHHESEGRNTETALPAEARSCRLPPPEGVCRCLGRVLVLGERSTGGEPFRRSSSRAPVPRPAAADVKPLNRVHDTRVRPGIGPGKRAENGTIC